MSKPFNQEFLQDQIRRLKGLPRGEDRPWGTGKKGEKNYEPGLRDELFKALWEQSSSNEHSERVIDRLMETAQFCPTPAELIATAVTIRYDLQSEQEYSIPYERPDPKAFCTTCKGNGMLQQDGKWDRCACAAGQDYPQTLIDLQNAYEVKKAPLGKSKSESESRRYVDRVLIR